jgi:hypothetical protein
MSYGFRYDNANVTKKTDRRMGNMIATGTVDALPQFDPFHTIRPIHTMHTLSIQPQYSINHQNPLPHPVYVKPSHSIYDIIL